MPRRYSIADARTNLPSIVDQAEGGVDIELTRRGKPVAVVISLREFERLRGERPRFSDAYRTFLEKHSLAEVGLDERLVASTREKGDGRRVPL
jgi:prevent-host-death family protein